MSEIAIPEKFTAELQALAEEDDRSLQSLVDEALSSYISGRYVERSRSRTHAELSTQMPRAEVAALLLDRLEQAKRGEVISSEEVDRWFNDLFKELEAR